MKNTEKQKKTSSTTQIATFNFLVYHTHTHTHTHTDTQVHIWYLRLQTLTMLNHIKVIKSELSWLLGRWTTKENFNGNENLICRRILYACLIIPLTFFTEYNLQLQERPWHSKRLNHFRIVVQLSFRQWTFTFHTTSLCQLWVGGKYMDGIILV